MLVFWFLSLTVECGNIEFRDYTKDFSRRKEQKIVRRVEKVCIEQYESCPKVVIKRKPHTYWAICE